MLRKHHDAALRQKTLCDAELLRLERNTLEVKKILVALTDSLKNLKDQLSVSRKAMNHDQRKQKQVRAHSFVSVSLSFSTHSSLLSLFLFSTAPRWRSRSPLRRVARSERARAAGAQACQPHAVRVAYRVVVRGKVAGGAAPAFVRRGARAGAAGL